MNSRACERCNWVAVTKPSFWISPAGQCSDRPWRDTAPPRNLEEARRVDKQTASRLAQLAKEREMARQLAENATRAKERPCP